MFEQRLGLVLSQTPPLSCHTCALWCWWGSIIAPAGGPSILCGPENHWMGFSAEWQGGRGGSQNCAGVGSLVCLCMFRPAPGLRSSFTDLQCCWHPQWWCWLSGGSSLFFFVSVLSLHSKTKTNRVFFCVCVSELLFKNDPETLTEKLLCRLEHCEAEPLV